jgi:dTDP-4-dehydrorhamnose 3,5-epimerase-like enzyme
LNINFEEIKKKYNIDELFFSDKDKKHPTLKEFYKNNPF